MSGWMRWPPPAEALRCTCPSGDGSLRWPCPAHPPEAQERPAKPAECADGCPDQQVCDHCQWPPGPGAEAQPEPNWCRTCGRRPHDPVAALCPDTRHRKAPPPSAPVGAYTYASTQATKCAGCGEHKHTPLRIDAMGGYVCLTCIDQKLGSLLGEFGYTPSAPVGVDEVVRKVCERLDKVADYARTIDGETVVVPLSNLSAVLTGALSGAFAAKQPTATLPDVDDDDLTVAYMAGRHDGRKEAQQPAAVDGAVRQAAQEMVAAIRAVPEAKLLALDDDPHPPSALSVLVDDLAAALAAQPGGSDNDR